MKHKRAIGVAIFIIVLAIIIIFFPPEKPDSSKIPKDTVSFRENTNQFYYDSLVPDEKQACDKILGRIKTHKGGKIEFDTPISHYNFSRVMQTIMYDNGKSDWSFVFGYPYDKDNKILSTETVNFEKETYEKNVQGIYAQINIKAPEKLKGANFEFSKDGVLLNGDALQNILESSSSDALYYKNISKRVRAIETDIISGMPKKISKEDAIKYFTEWIMKNMDYDSEMENHNYNDEPVTEHLDDLNKIANVSYEQCIINKKGLCSGIAVVLSKLCNQVGIDSYVVLGEVIANGKSELHAWVAVKIGNNTYYTDPTFSLTSKYAHGLRTKAGMVKTGTGLPRYEFSKYFDY